MEVQIANAKAEAIRATPADLTGLVQPAVAAPRPVKTHIRAWASRLGQAALELPASSWLVVDALLIAAGLMLGYDLVGVTPAGYGPEHIAIWQAHAVFIGSFMGASLIFGLYERETLWSRSRILTRTVLTTVAAVVAGYAIVYVLMYSQLSRRAVGCAILLYMISGTTFRLAVWWLIHHVRRSLLIVGPESLYDSFMNAKRQGLLSEYRLVGFTMPTSEAPRPHKGYLGPCERIDAILKTHHVSDIVVGAKASSDPAVMTWVVPCLKHGCRVTNEPTFYEKATGQVLVDRLTPDWFLFADLNVAVTEGVTVKRIVDLLTALFGLVLSLPLWLVIALMIKLDDKGPVFYSQDRVGQRGRAFRLFKFRTMRINAETGESVWASPNDPRVTRVGRFLRRSRFDELPQLYNILLGQMSLVGPRPERPDIVARLRDVLPFYDQRHLIKPGLTGWAQISYKYGASIEDAKRKLQFDLFYLKNMCMELDVMIVFRTLGTFLRGGC